MFFENPYLPDGKVKLCLADSRISQENLFALNERKIDYIFAYRHNNILNGIDTHPDMTLCHLGENFLVTEPLSYSYYREMLDRYGFDIICGETQLSDNYPYDIAYNALILKGTLFANLKYTDPTILAFAEKRGWQLVHTPQGYAKCSVYPVTEEAVITQDEGMSRIFREHGFDVLCLKTTDSIRLHGFDYGFIGGAGGKIDRFNAAFFGNINKHKEFEKIEMFLSKYAVKPQCLSQEELRDHGSLMPLLG